MIYEPSEILESENHNRIFSDISDARLWNECQVSIVLVSLVRTFCLVSDTGNDVQEVQVRPGNHNSECSSWF